MNAGVLGGPNRPLDSSKAGATGCYELFDAVLVTKLGSSVVSTVFALNC